MATGVEKHTGEYIATELKKCINEIDPLKVFGVISDNASAMEKAKKIVSEEFKHITAYSCAAHTFNLLVGDIMKLGSLRTVENSCKEIIKEITGSHRNLAAFNLVQKNKYGATRSLKLPVKTRWGSILFCIDSLILSKEALQIFVVSESDNIKFSRNIRVNILDNDIFWVRLEKLKKILQPIVKWITVLESDEQTISKVFLAVREVEICLNNETKTLPIRTAEETELLNVFRNRRAMLLKPLHLAAYLLDPKYCGEHLSNDEHILALEFIEQIVTIHPKFQNTREVISSELTNYLAKTGLWRLPFVWDAAKKTDGISWWLGVCCKTNLKDVATAILGMPATSAATERSFSSFSFIHCKKRNRLTTERAGKLLFIAHNSKLLSPSENEQSTSTSQELPDEQVRDQAGPSHQIESTINIESDQEEMPASESPSEEEGDYSLHDSDSSVGPEDFSELNMDMDPDF